METAQFDADDIGFEVLCGPGAGETLSDILSHQTPEKILHPIYCPKKMECETNGIAECILTIDQSTETPLEHPEYTSCPKYIRLSTQ